MKVKIWFETKQRLLSSTVQDEIIKAYCCISFLQENNQWSPAWNAIIDTGAHTSLLPRYAWENLNHEPLSESLFLGIKSNLLCSVPCKVARIAAVIYDEEDNSSKPFIMNSYLAKSNDVPIILGMSTALENFQLNINYTNKTGFLDDGI